jgi:putative membrane protein
MGQGAAFASRSGLDDGDLRGPAWPDLLETGVRRDRVDFGPAGDLTVRVYRFSLGLGIVAILSGLWLFWWWNFPAWGWVKLGIVALLAAHYGWTGRLILAKRGIFDESDFWLRVFNEISVLGAIGVLFLVVFKPF